jgi:phosphogluconate dehydratase
MTKLHPKIEAVTQTVRMRSSSSRAAYLNMIAAARSQRPNRHHLGCSNLAHTASVFAGKAKEAMLRGQAPVVGIVTAYNDMLSAHQPLAAYPAIIKEALAEVGAYAMVAGGVPAMCDGVTQGYPGMELSLFSRDTIALATAVALSHNTFDAALCLGVCDKIVPGLLIGALRFGHLPFVFVPAGPMRSGISNERKGQLRVLYAEGNIGQDELLDAESQSYHSPGTCTFYGTANTNQMMMEFMGLHLPGSSFVNHDDPLRKELTRLSAQRVASITSLGNDPRPLGQIVDERAIVNAIVGLVATGGSTNHTIHLIAIARAAGIIINWDDFSDVAQVVPLLTRVYPNGSADVNRLHEVGGIPFVIRELLGAGLLHGDTMTIVGDRGLESYTRLPRLFDEIAAWEQAPATTGDRNVLRPMSEPFAEHGGLMRMQGNLGRAVMKTSAVQLDAQTVRAPARVFSDQAQVKAAFEAGELDRDVVVVLRFQGPSANGMPELHKLTSPLVAVQKRGFKVALVTDGRMSGASGKIAAAIHVTPEAALGGPLARIEDGDWIVVDGKSGELSHQVDPAEFAARQAQAFHRGPDESGCGRELFTLFRQNVSSAEEGASPLGMAKWDLA